MHCRPVEARGVSEAGSVEIASKPVASGSRALTTWDQARKLYACVLCSCGSTCRMSRWIFGIQNCILIARRVWRASNPIWLSEFWGALRPTSARRTAARRTSFCTPTVHRRYPKPPHTLAKAVLSAFNVSAARPLSRLCLFVPLERACLHNTTLLIVYHLDTPPLSSWLRVPALSSVHTSTHPPGYQEGRSSARLCSLLISSALPSPQDQYSTQALRCTSSWNFAPLARALAAAAQHIWPQQSANHHPRLHG